MERSKHHLYSDNEESVVVSPDPPLSFFETMIGLIASPIETTEKLFSEEPPRHCFKILSSLLFVVFAPVVYLWFKYDYLADRSAVVVLFSAIVFFSSFIFVITEFLCLSLLGLKLSIKQIFASYCYGIAPLVLFIATCHLIDVILTGRLTLGTFIITGIRDSEGLVLENFFYAHLISKIYFLIILFAALRKLADISNFRAFLFTIFSSLPFYFAIIVTLEFANLIDTRATQHLFQLLENSLVTARSLF